MDALELAQYDLVPALASALLHSVWQNALLAAAAALALRALAGAGAAWRHNAGMGFLVAMLLMPAVQFLRFWEAPSGQASDGLLVPMSAPRLSGIGNVFVQEMSPVAVIVVLIWLLGACLMLARHIGGLRAVAAMERGPHHALAPHWQQRVKELRRMMGIGRPVTVWISEDVRSPCAARLLRPVIWMPMALLARAPIEHIEALLAHELAHIARKDWLWNGVQCIVESLLFFHPAVWWLSRRIRQEREHACDDLAVAACIDAIALAEALTALECERHSSPSLVLAARGGSPMQRVSRLLSGPPSRGRWAARALFALLSVSGLLVVAQIGVAGGLPDLEVVSSTPGALGPNDYREIRANGFGRQRVYRESIDAQGRRTETYRENGAARPIDAGVRRWIAEVSRMSAESAVPPTMPHEDYSAEQAALVAMVGRRAEVVGRVGSPATPTGTQTYGTISFDGDDGNADIRIEYRGPNGTTVVAVEAEMRGRVWSLESVLQE